MNAVILAEFNSIVESSKNKDALKSVQSAGWMGNLNSEQLGDIDNDLGDIELALFHLQDQIPYASRAYPAVNKVYSDYIDVQGQFRDVEVAVSLSGATDPVVEQEAQQLATMIGQLSTDTSAAQAALGSA